jgi:hypothetical protein
MQDLLLGHALPYWCHSSVEQLIVLKFRGATEVRLVHYVSARCWRHTVEGDSERAKSIAIVVTLLWEMKEGESRCLYAAVDVSA